MHRCGQGKRRFICHQWYVDPVVIILDLSLTTFPDSRSLLTASYRSLLRTYILSPPNHPPSQNLVALLSSPRARLIDLSYLDDASGTTLLHEATRRKDFRLVDSAIRAGADVFIRDRKGRTVQEVVGKDDKMRVFLRQCKNHLCHVLLPFHPIAVANNDTTLLNDGPISGPSTLRGYLNKYTNVARGYSTRFFVLKDGALSCMSLFFFLGQCLFILRKYRLPSPG